MTKRLRKEILIGMSLCIISCLATWQALDIVFWIWNNIHFGNQ